MFPRNSALYMYNKSVSVTIYKLVDCTSFCTQTIVLLTDISRKKLQTLKTVVAGREIDNWRERGRDLQLDSNLVYKTMGLY